MLGINIEILVRRDLTLQHRWTEEAEEKVGIQEKNIEAQVQTIAGIAGLNII